MSEERLQKYLARAGIASRRKAEGLIDSGIVTVNGRVAELGVKVGPADEVRVRGRVVIAPLELVTLMLNKPPGVVTTVVDDRKRSTVMNLVPAVPGLHPVGRLDRDSEGLLLLTTDGKLTLRLTHPRYGHQKEYRVWCQREVRRRDLRRLEEGVELEDGAARAYRALPGRGGCLIILTEGRNRQIRRMLSLLGYTVNRLKRTRIAGLRLEGLEPAQFRLLTETDLVKLGYTHPVP